MTLYYSNEFRKTTRKYEFKKKWIFNYKNNIYIYLKIRFYLENICF